MGGNVFKGIFKFRNGLESIMNIVKILVFILFFVVAYFIMALASKITSYREFVKIKAKVISTEYPAAISVDNVCKEQNVTYVNMEHKTIQPGNKLALCYGIKVKYSFSGIDYTNYAIPAPGHTIQIPNLLEADETLNYYIATAAEEFLREALPKFYGTDEMDVWVDMKDPNICLAYDPQMHKDVYRLKYTPYTKYEKSLVINRTTRKLCKYSINDGKITYIQFEPTGTLEAGIYFPALEVTLNISDVNYNVLIIPPKNQMLQLNNKVIGLTVESNPPSDYKRFITEMDNIRTLISSTIYYNTLNPWVCYSFNPEEVLSGNVKVFV